METERPEPRSEAARLIAEFHGHPNAEHADNDQLRLTLHEEEHAELVTELQYVIDGQPNRWQIARELADVVYVAYGTALAHGIDLDAALVEIHRAAMDKMDANVRRADGKVIKHPGFFPPDMTEALGD